MNDYEGLNAYMNNFVGDDSRWDDETWAAIEALYGIWEHIPAAEIEAFEAGLRTRETPGKVLVDAEVYEALLTVYQRVQFAALAERKQETK